MLIIAYNNDPGLLFGVMVKEKTPWDPGIRGLLTSLLFQIYVMPPIIFVTGTSNLKQQSSTQF